MKYCEIKSKTKKRSLREIIKGGNTMPSLSILMPVYNEEKYIYTAVNSVLSQNCDDFELIIANDGSSDRTGEILDGFVSNKLKVLHLERVGKNAAINKAYKAAKGKWFAFFAGDDIMPPGSLKARLEGVQRHEFQDRVVGLSRVKIVSEDKRYDGIEVPKKKTKGYATGLTVTFSKKYAELIFPLPEEFPNEDTWTNLHFHYIPGTKVHIPVVTAIYRIHADNSMKRTSEFTVFNKLINDRARAYGMFKNKFSALLDPIAYNKLRTSIKAESLRFQGETFKLMFIRGLTLKERFRAIFHSNPLLYSIKHRLPRVFIGW